MNCGVLLVVSRAHLSTERENKQTSRCSVVFLLVCASVIIAAQLICLNCFDFGSNHRTTTPFLATCLSMTHLGHEAARLSYERHHEQHVRRRRAESSGGFFPAR